MKTIIPYNSFIWGIAALAAGILIFLNPDTAFEFSIKVLGILSITIGIIQLLVQLLQNRKRENKIFPIIAIIVTVFGIMLLANPTFWVKFFMMILGLVMVFLSLNQFFTYSSIKKSGIKLPLYYYIFPTLFFAAGITTVIEPAFLTEGLTYFVACWIILYGVVEVVSYFALRKR